MNAYFLFFSTDNVLLSHLLKLFVMTCCYDVLLWRYVMTFCDDVLLWRFVMTFCYDVMLWRYVITLCYDILLCRWWGNEPIVKQSRTNIFDFFLFYLDCLSNSLKIITLKNGLKWWTRLIILYFMRRTVYTAHE